MKKIILIIGPNGVGKSTTARAFLDKNTRCAYIDADWCRCINPFDFTHETKKTVTENIFCLFKNYLTCPDIDMVVFPYGFHGERKEIFDAVIQRLNSELLEYKLFPIILTCSLEENIKRVEKDKRDIVRIKRGIKNTFHFYDNYPYTKIDTTKESVEQVVDKILELIEL